ncbi:hypothetical protein V494_02381 [Pseudogymnoascus sp. VKM F-4513 (FW-928)]|nr:hypothetical protein V494_02381 [Pseudogymnoascus sp. VKM F-4513 (FW-928)]
MDQAEMSRCGLPGGRRDCGWRLGDAMRPADGLGLCRCCSGAAARIGIVVVPDAVARAPRARDYVAPSLLVVAS